jgi:hypothetical protein
VLGSSSIQRICLTLTGLAVVLAIVASPAFAENPLYCNKSVHINEGCGEGPRGLLHINEARNESGGCIAVQVWTVAHGYLPTSEECAGEAIGQELKVKEESFPRCWNRTNAFDLIHCRYALWAT